MADMMPKVKELRYECACIHIRMNELLYMYDMMPKVTQIVCMSACMRVCSTTCMYVCM